MGKAWRILLNILTFIVIAFVGTRFIHDEPYRSLWVLVSGVITLVIWYFINRYLDRRE